MPEMVISNECVCVIVTKGEARVMREEQRQGKRKRRLGVEELVFLQDKAIVYNYAIKEFKRN